MYPHITSCASSNSKCFFFNFGEILLKQGVFQALNKYVMFIFTRKFHDITFTIWTEFIKKFCKCCYRYLVFALFYFWLNLQLWCVFKYNCDDTSCNIRLTPFGNFCLETRISRFSVGLYRFSFCLFLILAPLLILEKSCSF